MSKKPYTVLLLYPDYENSNGDDTYLAHVEADSPNQAASEALCQVEFDTEIDREDFAVLFITEGHHDDVKP